MSEDRLFQRKWFTGCLAILFLALSAPAQENVPAVPDALRLEIYLDAGKSMAESTSGSSGVNVFDAVRQLLIKRINLFIDGNDQFFPLPKDTTILVHVFTTKDENLKDNKTIFSYKVGQTEPLNFKLLQESKPAGIFSGMDEDSSIHSLVNIRLSAPVEKAAILILSNSARGGGVDDQLVKRYTARGSYIHEARMERFPRSLEMGVIELVSMRLNPVFDDLLGKGWGGHRSQKSLGWRVEPGSGPMDFVVQEGAKRLKLRIRNDMSFTLNQASLRVASARGARKIGLSYDKPGAKKVGAGEDLALELIGSAIEREHRLVLEVNKDDIPVGTKQIELELTFDPGSSRVPVDPAGVYPLVLPVIWPPPPPPPPAPIPQVSADFRFTPSSEFAPVVVKLENLCKNADSVRWNFGDGRTSQETAPGTITFEKPGAYTLSVEAVGADGKTVRSPGKILTVKQKPLPPVVALFLPNPSSGSAPLDVLFENQSREAVSYSWDFGDQGASTEARPTHTYTQAGTYAVILKAVSADGRSAFATNQVVVAAPIPVPPPPPPPPPPCPTAAFGFELAANGGPFEDSGLPNPYLRVKNQSQEAERFEWKITGPLGSTRTISDKSPRIELFEGGGDYRVVLTALGPSECAPAIASKTYRYDKGDLPIFPVLLGLAGVGLVGFIVKKILTKQGPASGTLEVVAYTRNGAPVVTDLPLGFDDKLSLADKFGCPHAVVIRCVRDKGTQEYQLTFKSTHGSSLLEMSTGMSHPLDANELAGPLGLGRFRLTMDAVMDEFEIRERDLYAAPASSSAESEPPSA